jgi:hypothetical protein
MVMMKRLRFLGCLLAALVMMPAYAVKVGSLYEAEVAVPSQAPEVRAEAIRQGFLDVLIKVSGNPDIANLPAIKTNIKRADYYVQEFGYSQPTVNTSTYTLKVRFDQDDVNRLLKSAGVVYWGETRPLTLVWLAVTDADHQTNIIGGETPGPILETMKNEGKRYGLPLIFPVMDMDDMNLVSPDHINVASLPLLQDAGKRYAPDAMLIGNIQPGDKGFNSQWTLALNQQQWSYTIPGDSLQAIMTSVMQQVSQTLSTRYVEKQAVPDNQWIKLTIYNVSEDHDLEQLMAYLKQLTPVQQVELSQVNGDTVELRVLVSGTVSTFQQNATIGQRLTFKGQDSTDNSLTYTWVH